MVDNRLRAVAQYVVGDTVCDVGCDHGKLCAQLLKTGRIKTAYGLDISPASLEKSKRCKEKLRLNNYHLLVSDGFTAVVDKQIDTGVICGIGSNETLDIIRDNLTFAKKLKRLVLCPQKNTYLVREYLFSSGFLMEEEDLVLERGKYYNVFVASPGREKIIDDVNIFVGRRLIEKKHPLLLPYLEQKLASVQKNLAALDINGKQEWIDKKAHLQRMQEAYGEGLRLCKLEN